MVSPLATACRTSLVASAHSVFEKRFDVSRHLAQETTSSVKRLHFVSGVSPRTYWAAALAWDLSLYR